MRNRVDATPRGVASVHRPLALRRGPVPQATEMLRTWPYGPHTKQAMTGGFTAIQGPCRPSLVKSAGAHRIDPRSLDAPRPCRLDEPRSVNGEELINMNENYGTIWVCRDCMLHHANGECGSCHDDHGHDQEPLSAVQAPYTVAMGMLASEHPCSADYEPMQEREHECDCETNTFSTSQCEGCGSYLHGERNAMTLFGPEGE